MFVHLNIDVWEDDSGNIYTKEKPAEIETKLIKSGTPIEHSGLDLFIRRICDRKIIFGPSCLPPIDRSGEDWFWKGFANK